MVVTTLSVLVALDPDDEVQVVSYEVADSTLLVASLTKVHFSSAENPKRMDRPFCTPSTHFRRVVVLVNPNNSKD